jgi:uncharacterized protein
MDREILVVFARAPVEGTVKTRLAAALGPAAALAAYRELGATVLRGVREPGRRIVVCHTPADAAGRVAEWLGRDLELEPQSEGDLGARLRAAFGARFAAGAVRVVVIGTDCPTVDAAVVAEAFASLERADVVLGPARDGGYYLIGLTRPSPTLFLDIPWSTPRVLAATLERAAAAGLRVHLLDEREDVDTAVAWQRWRARAGPPS